MVISEGVPMCRLSASALRDKTVLDAALSESQSSRVV